MKTAIVNAFGAPDIVSLGEHALRANEVTLRIDAASANPLDLKMIAGYMQQFFPFDFPYVPGRTSAA